MSDRTTAAYWARAPYRHVKKRRAHRYFGFTAFGACSSCGPLPPHIDNTGTHGKDNKKKLAAKLLSLTPFCKMKTAVKLFFIVTTVMHCDC